MSGAKWTPGPWVADDHGYQVRAADDQMNVCDIRGWGYLTGIGAMNLREEKAEAIQKANAHLISAAPDLYAACEAMLNDPCDVDECPHDDYQSCPAEMARVAMAKARGES